jgi:Carboxypeptidase regulatory-like domain/TonB-dependent Receptor Plug Domain
MGRAHRTVVSVSTSVYLALACVCLLLVQAKPSFAQVDEGAITGTVTDTTGAVVPGASVTLLNIDQGITLQTKTNSSGGYTFSPVRIGNYTVTATAQGFAKTTQKNVHVNVAQVLQVNVEMKLGAASETVEVNTAPPLLQTEEASVGQVISQQQVNALPLNGRNFTFLAQLGAGMQTPQADTRGNAASGAFSANGLRPAQNNYLLDGIDNNSNAVDFLNGTNFVILPPVDAIQEFNVQTADFSAQLGRAAGAVLNATIKSGTNSLHGAAWEFFRNNVLDASDWFEKNTPNPISSELRLNQFGASIGGPIIKNKLFFFGDYEGYRRVQGNTSGSLTVPNAQERNSGYTDLTTLLLSNASSTPKTDLLGRSIPVGAVLDPASTRSVTAGQVDPVSGRVATGTGYVRDPFSAACGPGTTVYTLAGCGDLNQIPAARIDPNAVKLLNLYPQPTSGGLLNNFSSSPNLYEHKNSFDIRGDFNPEEKDQIFFRYSFSDDPQYIPGPFGGIADGGAFQQGDQQARSHQMVAGYTHVFTQSTINQVRGGFAHLHTTRFGPVSNQLGIPEQYGIQGIPQVAENGGLPAFSFSGLATLGSNSFLPSDEISQTLQVTDDFTKVYGKHSFKMGAEYQHVKFSTLQPAWSHGQWNYNGSFTDVPNSNSSTNGIADFLIPPAASNGDIPADVGVPYSGGANQAYASNINKTYDERTYFAGYFQDDWKVTPSLTLNLGLRWDYFSPISESNGAQANFIASGPPDNKPQYLIPASGKADRSLSSTANNPSLNGNGFLDLLAKDGIALNETDKYGKALVQTQKGNVAPRFGFAFQANQKLVMRGGFGMFYNSFENQGYGPNIGENYPFVYNFNYVPRGSDSVVAPISSGTPFEGCATAGPGGTATFEAGFSCVGFTPLAVNASGLGLQGLQFDYQTPRTYATNLTVQYSLNHATSFQVAYVLTDGAHLQTGVGVNNVSALLPSGQSTSDPAPNNEVPFPDFSQGSSYHRTLGSSIYNGLQTKLEQQFSNGLTYLLTYTWSKTMSDAGDLLNGGSQGGYRAPYVPGLGPKFDWALANFDIRNVFHFSGGYQLPFGKGMRYMNHGGVSNALLGGWAVNWIVTLQGGQPLNLGCPTGVTAGTNCNVIKVAGQSQKLGIKVVNNGSGTNLPQWLGNPAAFAQACQLGNDGNPVIDSPPGCIPLTGSAILGDRPGQTTTPGFHRFDFSTFKNFPLGDRFSMQFRAEFFNILNHPNFNAPGFGGNGVVSIGNATNFTNGNFGLVGSTRDAPFDPRQIQFAVKLYY